MPDYTVKPMPKQIAPAICEKLMREIQDMKDSGAYQSGQCRKHHHVRNQQMGRLR